MKFHRYQKKRKNFSKCVKIYVDRNGEIILKLNCQIKFAADAYYAFWLFINYWPFRPIKKARKTIVINKIKKIAERRSTGVLRAVIAFLLCLMLFPMASLASDSGSVKDEVTGITVSKTAGALSGNLETEVTLSFPGKEDHLGSDIVFVLDKSGASDWNGIFAKAKEFLDYVREQAVAHGLEVKIGVVLFNYKANIELPLSDITTSYDDIVDALGSSKQHGTNMHAGLLAGKALLDADTEVSASRKHLVLISDGATYLYSKDDDYTTCCSRSFGDPKLQTNPATGLPFGGIDREGGIWEFLNRDGNVTYASDGSEGTAFQYALSDPVKLGEYLDLKRQHGAGTFDEYDFAYGYDNGQTIPYLNRTALIPISNTAVTNIDKAFVSCDDVFQEIAAEGYNTYVYYEDVADFDGSNFLRYLVRNTNDYQLDTDFAELENAVVNLISAGSTVDDIIGSDFDFVDDTSKISLKVGDETLHAKKLSETEYGFGTPTDGEYPFVLTYTEGGSESLHLDINKTVLASAPLTLTYSEKLVNVPAEPGTYRFDTNESAVLNCVDSMGNLAGTIAFPVPQVVYTLSEEEKGGGTGEGGGAGNGSGNEDGGANEGDNSEDGTTETSPGAPETGDGRSVFWSAVLMASAAALACAAAARKKTY